MVNAFFQNPKIFCVMIEKSLHLHEKVSEEFFHSLAEKDGELEAQEEGFYGTTHPRERSKKPKM